MDGTSRQIFNLTLAVFRVTDCFGLEARQEQLAIRDQAFRLLKKVVGFDIGINKLGDVDIQEVEIEIKALVGDFGRLKAKSLANPVNFKVLEREYFKFLNDFVNPVTNRVGNGVNGQNKIAPKTKKETSLDFGRTRGRRLDFRKRQILNHLQESGPAGIHDLTALFQGAPGPKTIQRDLNSLLASRAIIRLGNRRWSRYATRTAVV